jgi:hypothetical protein
MAQIRVGGELKNTTKDHMDLQELINDELKLISQFNHQVLRCQTNIAYQPVKSLAEIQAFILKRYIAVLDTSANNQSKNIINEKTCLKSLDNVKLDSTGFDCIFNKQITQNFINVINSQYIDELLRTKYRLSIIERNELKKFFKVFFADQNEK